MQLTPKQEKFVQEYLVDLNATAAARRAGYSVKTCEQQGPRLLGNVGVAAAIQAAREKLAAETQRTVHDVMADIAAVKREAMRMITDPQTGQAAMLSPKDALRALELEGKHRGAFTERVQLSGANGGPIETVSEIRLIPVKVSHAKGT